jgi:uncharacterized membrane protein (GlpM family)
VLKEIKEVDRAMKEMVFRFLIGGALVSAFAATADVLKPKSFAGLFGAAPSVALATLGLAISAQGKRYASTEAGAMVAGAVGFLVYASCVSWLMMRYKMRTTVTSSAALAVWFLVTFLARMAWPR